MATSFEIATGHVTIETRYDGRRIGTISYSQGRRAGNAFYRGFTYGSQRRFNKLWGLFFRPIKNLDKQLRRTRIVAILSGILGSALALVPTVAQLGSAVGAGAVPAMLSWGSSIFLVRGLLGNLSKSIKSQVLKQVNDLSDSIKKLAQDTARPGLNAFFQEALTHAPILNKYVRELAGHASDVGFAFRDLLNREANIRRIRTTLDGTARATGMWYSLLDEAAEVILVIAAAGMPLFERFTRSMLRVGHTIHDWILLKESTGELAKWLNESYETLEQIGRGGRDFLIGLFNLINGGIFGTEKVADAFARWGAAFREWTTHRENIERIRDVIAFFVRNVGNFFRFAAAATAVHLALAGIGKLKSTLMFFRTLLTFGALGGFLVTVGSGLALIAGGFVTAFVHSKDFRRELGELVKMVQQRLAPIFRDWWQWLEHEFLPLIEELALEGVGKLNEELDKLLTKVEENQEGLKEWRPLLLLFAKALAFVANTAIEEVVGAFGQIVTALGWIGKAIGAARKFFRNLPQWAGTAVDETAEFFRELPDRIMGWLKALPGNLVKWGTEALSLLAFAIGFGLGKIVDYFVKLPGRVGRFVAATWEKAIVISQELLFDLVTFVSKLPGRIITALINLPGVVLKRFDETWSSAKKTSEDWGKRILTFVINFPSKVWTALVRLKDRLVSRFAEGWAAATGQQKSKVEAIVKHILGIPGRAWNALRTLASRLADRARTGWASFQTALGQKVASTITYISQIPGRILTALRRIPGLLKESGRQLIQGFLVGVQARIREVGGLGSWFKSNLVDPVVNAVKRFFNIRSPSKVFQGIGRQLVAGLWKGVVEKDPGKVIGKIFGGMDKALISMVQKGMVSLANLPASALRKLGGLFDDLFGGGGGSASGLVGFARLAWDVFAKTFGLTMGGYRARGSVPGSDHPKGKAIDIMTTNALLHRLIIEVGKRLPGAKYWISMRQIASAPDWKPRPYSGPSPHTDHVHWSFFHKGGRLPEDIVGMGRRTGRMYSLLGGETVVPKGGDTTTIGHQGAVNHYHFAPGSITLDARSVRKMSDLIDLIEGLQSSARAAGMQPKVKVA